MLVSIVSESQFNALQTAAPAGYTVDTADCNEGHYFLNKGGDYALIIHSASNSMSNGELHNIRMQVAKASGDENLVKNVMGIKEPTSASLPVYPVLATGVPSVTTDGLYIQLSVNMFQIFQSAKYLNDNGSYCHSNFNVFIPKVSKFGGRTVVSNAYEQIDEWFAAAKSDDFVKKNGDVIVALYDEDEKKWSSTGHSQQILSLDEGARIAFNIQQREDGSFFTEPVEVDGRTSKAYKVKAAKLTGDFSIMALVGSRKLTSTALDAADEDFLSGLDTVVVSTVPNVEGKGDAGSSSGKSAADLIKEKFAGRPPR